MTYAHEHLVIDGGRPVELSPDFLLADVELHGDRANRRGGRRAHDRRSTRCPSDCGRNPAKLAELSRRTGVQLVAATGLHHERFYGPSHWSLRASEDELADLFIADVVGRDRRARLRRADRAADRRPGGHRQGRRQPGRPVSTRPADLPCRRSDAPPHGRPGPHPLRGRDRRAGADLDVLVDAGVPAEHISLSHVDKVVDRGYHRELLATGAFAVYDQAFRWGDRENGTLRLLEWAVADGHAGQVMLGMDAARQGYYRHSAGRRA